MREGKCSLDLAAGKDFREWFVVARTITRGKDCEGDYSKVGLALRDLLLVDLRDSMSWIAEGAATECPQNSVAGFMIPQCVQLGRNTSSGIVRVELRTVTKVLSGRAKLEEGEHLIIWEPWIPKVCTRSIFPSSDADAWSIRIQVDGTVSRRKEPRHLRDVPIYSGVILPRANPKMAVSAAEQVFFLRNGALHICTAGNKWACHIEDSKACPVGPRKLAYNLPPVTRQHPNLKFRVRYAASVTPALKILCSETVVTIGRIGLLEGTDGLTQNTTPAR
jgi:hypothetical protein